MGVMRYFFAADGTYLGAYDDGSVNLVPEGSIEVSEPPNHGLDRLVDGVIVPYVHVPSLNERLELAFKQILPNHLGQPYLTDAVVTRIMQTKVAVIDANQIDPTGFLGAATIRGLELPNEMNPDRDTILALFN
jgi:hypothetical protein